MNNLEPEIVKNTVYRALKMWPEFAFAPTEKSPWYIVLLGKVDSSIAELSEAGFVGVSYVKEMPPRQAFMLRFDTYPAINHPDVGRLVQFATGKHGTIIDYSPKHPYASVALPAWLILIEDDHLTSGWYTQTQFLFSSKRNERKNVYS